ncbi:chemotaxis protein CheW [Burkholderia sp. JP2-270]|uniref:chemotaxis protein CheW n=1 Tax=Burkholderia sp. JP2-270 TaxID=2217913 RepID=UPI000DA35B7C|nr:chemotaxis protein CheW [Burkholderia sp. JP2-270]AWV05070.1 chemotaxis protein CheW [Burkholderia sp. JP2-270]
MVATQPVNHDENAAPTLATRYVVVALAGRRLALPLIDVERGVRMVDITCLANAPPTVRGIINVAGRIVPVIDIRRHFGLADREVSASDHLLITRASTQGTTQGPARTLALWVDAIEGVMEATPQRMPAMLPGDEMHYAAGAIKLADGLVLVHDLDALLSFDDACALELLLAETTGKQGDSQ